MTTAAGHAAARAREAAARASENAPEPGLLARAAAALSNNSAMIGAAAAGVAGLAAVGYAVARTRKRNVKRRVGRAKSSRKKAR